MKFFIHIFFWMVPLLGCSQFFGGNGDGARVLESPVTTLNPHYVYCAGNSGDGFGLKNFTGYPFPYFFIFNGGHGDGMVRGVGTGTVNDQNRYLTGGPADGAAHYFNSLPLNEPFNYCSGGSGDGMYFRQYSASLNNMNAYCNGGGGDGLSLNFANTFTYGYPVYCAGDSGDGCGFLFIPSLTLNEHPHYCNGSAGDGLAFLNHYGQINQIFLYAGGVDDGGIGFTSGNLQLGQGTWTGNISSDWSTNGNWKHNIIPNHEINVFIPPGRQHYPDVNQSLSVKSSRGFYKCNRIDIASQGYLISRDKLYIDGIMNISGLFTSFCQPDSCTQISLTGKMTLLNGAEINLGRQ